uniref:Uncharacterized protein n=1 Tax=Physcomitrium patens TaxID=3218 RepID=A0A2K1IUI0_PHYPA|nr:uncharacterized protein LOC112273664 isoform X2 [Physcomitrium patens]PNR32941.1 hypothetical protein PHYPA_024884 [Physcomitrium patens]|eukprot:XP_024358457.1 uncharacterized protein LOC112273664 isoform X2 [Physcomitrella patens]
MLKEAFPLLVDEVGIHETVTASEEPEAQVSVAKPPSTRPRLPVIFNRLKTKPRLKAVKQYLASFEYWLKLQTNFNSQKQRPLLQITETAKTIVNAPQPIKCVEAVFVALFLTAGLPDVERFPLSFQTVLDGQVYQHIVLLVQYFSKYGAFGISRWPEFGSIDLEFNSMAGVVNNYKTAYEEQGHVVEKIRLGLPVEHNLKSKNFVCWRYLELDLEVQPWSECVQEINFFAAKAKRLWEIWVRSGKGEDPRQIYIRQTKRLLASRESSPPKTKRLNLDSGLTVPELSSEVAAEGVENTGILELTETPSIESGEVTGNALIISKDAKEVSPRVLPRDLCSNDTRVAVRSPTNHGFCELRKIKKWIKICSVRSKHAAIRSVKSKRPMKDTSSLPRSARNSIEQPLAVSRCLFGINYSSGTPGIDGSKTFWECLRALYQSKNEARLLLLKNKLADIRMEGPLVEESYRVVQDIFQQLVGIGEAIERRLHGFEETINSLSENFDAAVQNVDSQQLLHSLKQISQQLVEVQSGELQPITILKKEKKNIIPARKITSRKLDPRSSSRIQYCLPPCNWCRQHGHRMRDCEDLDKEIKRRVREYKNRMSPTSPKNSQEEPNHTELATEAEVRSSEFTGKPDTSLEKSKQSKISEEAGGPSEWKTPIEVASQGPASFRSSTDQLISLAGLEGMVAKKRKLSPRRLDMKLMHLLERPRNASDGRGREFRIMTRKKTRRRKRY